MKDTFQPAVYLLASKPDGTLYVGVTLNLAQRVFQHREGFIDGFTKQYAVKMLVWYELHSTMEFAIAKEKTMKEWKREWKIKRIRHMNPSWADLYASIL